jgi:CRISPR system Cascade subunit CasA
MIRRVAFAAAACGALAGCIHYQPAPVDVTAHANARAAAGFDRAAVSVAVARIAPTAQAEGTQLDRLDLFAALLLYDPRIAEARDAIETAQREAKAAEKVGAPVLTLTSEYANDPTTSSPWLWGGAFDFPLDYGALRAGRLDSARAAILGARYAYAETVWSERMALNRALIAWFAADARAPLLAESLAQNDRLLAALVRRENAGEISEVVVAPLRAQRAAAARALADGRAAQTQALTTIAATLDLPAAALAPYRLAWPGFLAAPDQWPSVTPAERLRAVAARGDVLAALVAYDQAEADLHAQVGKQAPQIVLSPGYTWERGLVKLPFAVGLALPSFDLNHAAIRAAMARRTAAGAAIESTLAGAQGAIDTALAARAAATDSWRRIAGFEVPPALAGAAQADAQLKRGEVARADWAAAQITATAARLAAIDALVAARQAEATLEEAMRRPLSGPEQAIDPVKLGEFH